MGYGGWRYLQRDGYLDFQLSEKNGNLKIVIERFWEKRGSERGLVAIQSFESLKKGTRTFNFLSNKPLHDILGPLGRYDHL